jgi:chromosome segregation ATPase
MPIAVAVATAIAMPLTSPDPLLAASARQEAAVGALATTIATSFDDLRARLDALSLALVPTTTDAGTGATLDPAAADGMDWYTPTLGDEELEIAFLRVELEIARDELARKDEKMDALRQALEVRDTDSEPAASLPEDTDQGLTSGSGPKTREDVHAQLAAQRRENAALRAAITAQEEHIARLGNVKEVKQVHAAAAYKKTRKYNTSQVLQEAAGVHEHYTAENAAQARELARLRQEVQDLRQVKHQNTGLLREVEKLRARQDRSAGGQTAHEWQSRHDKVAGEARALRAQLEAKEAGQRGERAGWREYERAAGEVAALKAKVKAIGEKANAELGRGHRAFVELRARLEEQEGLVAQWKGAAGELQAEIDALHAQAEKRTEIMPESTSSFQAGSEAEVEALRAKLAKLANLEAEAQARLHHEVALRKQWQSKHDKLASWVQELEGKLEKRAALAKMWQSKYDKLRLGGGV